MSASARRVHVDTHLCEGHGLCIDLAPEVFDLGEDEVARPSPIDCGPDRTGRTATT